MLDFKRKETGNLNQTPFDPNRHSGGEQQYTYVNGLGFLPETPKQHERKQLVLQYNILMFAILVFYFLRVGIAIPVVRFLSFCGFEIKINIYTGALSFSQTATQLGIIICDTLTYLVPALLIWLTLRRHVSFKKMVSMPYPGNWFYGLSIMIGASFAANFVNYLFIRLLKSGGLLVGTQGYSIPTDFWAFLLFLLSSTLLSAFLEEFLFRGVILFSMRRFGDITAVAVSTCLYALIQPRMDSMVYAFLMGMVFAYFTLKSGSFVLPFLASFLLKGLKLFLWMLQSKTSEQGTHIFIGALLFFLLFLSLVAFIRFILKDKAAFIIYDQETNLTNRTKLKYFFTNVGFWMIVVMAFLQIVKNIEIIN